MNFINKEQLKENFYFIKCSIKWIDEENNKYIKDIDVIIDTDLKIIKFDNDSTIYKQISLESEFLESNSLITSKIIDNKEINNIYKYENNNYLILYDDRTIQCIENNTNFKYNFGKIFF